MNTDIEIPRCPECGDILSEQEIMYAKENGIPLAEMICDECSLEYINDFINDDT